MIYQDLWLNGKLLKRGNRECASRYKVIHDFCLNNKPMNILDIGANMCYFGIRLIEDFDCFVVAFEFDHFDMRMNHVKNNKTKKLMLLNRKLKLEDISILSSCCSFDLVLAMSVLHHCPGNTQEWIKAIRSLGENIIIEFALDDSKRTGIRKDYFIPHGAKTLGYGISHLKEDIKRPIVLLKGLK